MNDLLKTGTIAVILSSLAGNAWAASSVCAKPADIGALQAIAVQQELMVSGLSCDALSRYNAFQTTFMMELRAQDRLLMQFMKRVSGARGEAEYHSFKTRAANIAQLRYIHDPVGFCSNTKEAFNNALDTPAKPTLAVFVSAQPVEDKSTYSTCDLKMATGIVADAPQDVPAPSPKPVPAVLSAQGSGLRPGN